MADTKATALTEDTAPTTDDLVYTVTDPGGTPASRKATLQNAEKGMILSGAGAPATTPNHVGQRYVDTTNDNVYVATDTVSSADWEQVTLGGTTIAALATATLAGTEALLLSTDEKATVDEVDTYISATTKTFTNKTLDDAKFDFALQEQTGTTYTLVLADGSKVVTMSNAAANTLTVPLNSSVAYAVGTAITVIQKGAGATTIAGATGVTVNGVSAGSAALSAQYSSVTLIKIATDTWICSGAVGTFA